MRIQPAAAVGGGRRFQLICRVPWRAKVRVPDLTRPDGRVCRSRRPVPTSWEGADSSLFFLPPNKRTLLDFFYPHRGHVLRSARNGTDFHIPLIIFEFSFICVALLSGPAVARLLLFMWHLLN